MEWETLKLEGSGAVRHLVLNRPGILNAINQQMLRDVVDACHYIDELADCRCVILRGEGRSFSAGADLKEAGENSGSIPKMMARSKVGARAVDTLTEVTPVTIAALHGHVIGGAACLAMACDFRIAAPSAQVCIREVRLGISLSWHSIPNVVHLVGPVRAKEMIMFGETYPAQTMLEYGFISELVEEDQLLPASEALAQKVVAQPPLPVGMTKASVNAIVKALDRSVAHLDEVGVTYTGRTLDSQRARDPQFTGTTPEWRHE